MVRWICTGSALVLRSNGSERSQQKRASHQEVLWGCAVSSLNLVALGLRLPSAGSVLNGPGSLSKIASHMKMRRLCVGSAPVRRSNSAESQQHKGQSAGGVLGLRWTCTVTSINRSCAWSALGLHPSCAQRPWKSQQNSQHMDVRMNFNLPNQSILFKIF